MPAHSRDVTPEHSSTNLLTAPTTIAVPAYRDMQLLHEVTVNPNATQRVFAKRIGVALGLTNFMLRRLAKKGYIKILNMKRNRIRYLITPSGMMEKARLTREYIQCSFFFYRNARQILREHLTQLAQEGNRRVLVYGVGEIAEIAVLTIQEVGLQLVGIVDGAGGSGEGFLGYPVRRMQQVPPSEYDIVVVTSEGGDLSFQRLHRVVALTPAVIHEASRAGGGDLPVDRVPHKVTGPGPDGMMAEEELSAKALQS